MGARAKTVLLTLLFAVVLLLLLAPPAGWFDSSVEKTVVHGPVPRHEPTQDSPPDSPAAESPCELLVLDARTGKPIGGAEVWFRDYEDLTDEEELGFRVDGVDFYATCVRGRASLSSNALGRVRLPPFTYALVVGSAGDLWGTTDVIFGTPNPVPLAAAR